MKLRYGVAVSTVEQLQELPALPKVDFLEIASALPEHPDFAVPSFWQKRLRRATGRSEARTLGSLIDAGGSIRQEFFRVFGAQCRKFAGYGIGEISLGIDWETVFYDPDYASALRDILRTCYGIAVKNGLTALLEVRIPGIGAGQAMEFIKFRNSFLLPVRTLIDLHPHEPGALDMLAVFSGQLPFESSKFRISVDVSGGNYLSEQLLHRIKESLHKSGAEVPELCFYPGKNADKTAYEQFNMVAGS